MVTWIIFLFSESKGSVQTFSQVRDGLSSTKFDQTSMPGKDLWVAWLRPGTSNTVSLLLRSAICTWPGVRMLRCFWITAKVVCAWGHFQSTSISAKHRVGLITLHHNTCVWCDVLYAISTEQLLGHRIFIHTFLEAQLQRNQKRCLGS